MGTGKSWYYPLIRLLLWIFALSIPFWLINPIANQFFYGLKVNLPLSSLMAVCPFIAAFILTGKENGIGGVRRLMASVFDPGRIKLKMVYVLIILIMPVIMLLSYFVLCLMEVPLPQLDIPLLSIPLFIFVFFIAAVFEETGWMGYAANRMIERLGVLLTGLLIGAVWAAWHVVPYMQASNTPFWIAGQCFFTIAARVIMVMIYNRTGRSVLGCVLFHTMINVTWVLFPNYGSQYAPFVTGAITALIAVVASVLWGTKTLAPDEPAK